MISFGKARELVEVEAKGSEQRDGSAYSPQSLLKKIFRTLALMIRVRE